MPQFLNTADSDFEQAFAAMLGAKREDSPDVDAVVARIIEDVRTRGDAALIELTATFDRMELEPDQLRISEAEVDAAIATVTAEERAALELAAERIRAYHARQMPEDAQWVDASGATLGWRWSAVAAAGLYVPGGLASYPSSVLMNAIPAKVAGVERLAITVPTPGGQINPLVLLAARLAGVGEIYRVGGAQAGAALGLPADQAARLALATLEGAAVIAADADAPPATLADRVASPGGSTRQGLNVLDRADGLVALLTDTLAASARRNREMAAETRSTAAGP